MRKCFISFVGSNPYQTYPYHTYQSYIKSQLFKNDETKLLARIRSRTLNGIKCNFRSIFAGDLNCQLNCWKPSEQPCEDTQSHILECQILKELPSVDLCSKIITYSDFFSDEKRQKEAIVLYGNLLEKRNKLINNQQADKWLTGPKQILFAAD